MTIKEDIQKHSNALKIILGVAALIAAFFLSKFVSDWLRPPDTVTTMSQERAETAEGVQDAAHKAKVPLSESQTKEIVTQIKEIHTTEQVPVYVVQSTGATAEKDSQQAVKDNRADFAIVTDPNHPEQEIKLDGLDKDAKIELNQYNIQAYKPVIRQIEAGKVMDGSGGWMVGASVSKKITKDGQYLGVGVDYIHHKDDNMAIAKIVYSF